MVSHDCTLWMFTGQGSLEPGSAYPLYKSDSTFKRSLDHYIDFLKEYVDIPLLPFLIETEPQHKELIQQTQFAQPTLVALQLAQIAMWESRVVKPKILLGHSIGEYAAAVAAGVMGAEEALKLAAIRGRLMSEAPPGGMVAVLASEKELPVLPKEVAIAAYNGPSMIVLSGPSAPLNEYLTNQLKEIRSIPLPVSHAFHSPMMKPAAQAFREYVRSTSLSLPSEGIRFVSTLTGQLENERFQNIDYWTEQIIQPVRFQEAITLSFSLETPEKIIELGPGSTLIKMAKYSVNSKKIDWIASSEATKRDPKRSLFRRTLLSWDHPSLELNYNSELDLKEEKSAKKAIYKVEWSALPKIALKESIDGGYLLVSQGKIEGPLPSNGVAVQIKEEKALLAALQEDSWSHLIFLESGLKGDLLLGLRLLQWVNDLPELQGKQVTFLIQTDGIEGAGLLGLTRTSRLERPDLPLRSIIFSPNKLLQALSCLDTYPEEGELSIDVDGIPYAPRLQHLESRDSENPITIRSNATYLISGGQGALGLVAAQFLTEKGARHLLLLSRNPKSHNQLPEIQALEKKGVEVISLACDVSKKEEIDQISRFFAEHSWPPLAGIIHTAGVLTDGTIPNQSAEKITQAFTTKVDGAQYLHDLLHPSDFILLFSSATAIFGSPGQSSYAAANAALDSLAQKWASSGEQALSIQWGAWSDGGMAARHGGARRAESAGFGVIPNSLGKEILAILFSYGAQGVVCASPIEWNRVAFKLPLFSHFQTSSNSLVSQKDETDLLALVREEVFASIGKPINDNESILDNGLDSLGSVSLRNRLVSLLKINLSSAFLFEHSTIQAIVRHIHFQSTRPQREKITQTPSKLPTLVIGAGVGGLSFARELKKAGYPVVIMEASNQAGGVWNTLANQTSKLQIDSPSYTFDSTRLPLKGDHRWSTSFPSQKEISESCRQIAAEFEDKLFLNTRVQRVKKRDEGEYEISYSHEGVEKNLLVSGVAAMTGGLHSPRLHIFEGEEVFEGYVGLGVANDTSLEIYQDASVVIVGHGAFAVENMRTALENGARHVTLLCRRRQIVFPSFCNWLLNSADGVTSISDVVEVLRPFYAACGLEMEELDPLSRDNNGEWMLDQTTVPAGSDIYFLGQMLGNVSVVVDEIAGFIPHGILTRKGRLIEADVLLKCLGSHTDETILPNLFGPESRIDGLWINGDCNLITYNDGAQIPRKVKSLMCGSYAFFVQVFATAYIHFRTHVEDFKAAVARITHPNEKSTVAERILVELWDFLEPAKRTVAERTRELCPYDRFQVEREAEWARYAAALGASHNEGQVLWNLIQPTLELLYYRNPNSPIEKRRDSSSPSLSSIFVPNRKKVLFLSGQGTNGRLVRSLLERTGWIGHSNFDFVIPDAPYLMPAFTNEEQLEKIGLNHLVEVGLYDKKAQYREWHAGFEILWEQYHKKTDFIVSEEDHKQWKRTLDYLSQIIDEYGPFDGIAGFCEGATVASVALHYEAMGKKLGLDSIQFFIAMSPWRSPVHEKEKMFEKSSPLSIPMLQIVGDHDMEVFLDAAPRFLSDFANPIEFRHQGQHVYPPLTPGLKNKLQQLLFRSNRSQKDLNRVLEKVRV